MFSPPRHNPLAARFATAIAITLSTSPAHAQSAPGVHLDNSGINGSLSRADVEKLGGDRTNAEVPKDPVLARAKAKAQSLPLLQSPSDLLRRERRKIGDRRHEPAEIGRQRTGDAGI